MRIRRITNNLGIRTWISIIYGVREFLLDGFCNAVDAAHDEGVAVCWHHLLAHVVFCCVFVNMNRLIQPILIKQLLNLRIIRQLLQCL